MLADAGKTQYHAHSVATNCFVKRKPTCVALQAAHAYQVKVVRPIILITAEMAVYVACRACRTVREYTASLTLSHHIEIHRTGWVDC